MRPGRGRAPLGGSARRVPRTTAGTSGQPTRTAVTNAPRWNFSRPGVRVKVPSGKNTTELSLGRVAQHATRIRGAAVAVEALHELRTESPQQRSGERNSAPSRA